MTKMTTFKEANAAIKALMPVPEGMEMTVSRKPKILDSKRFWPVRCIDARTDEELIMIGSVDYLADNGKLISFPSNPDIVPFEQHEELLLKEYDA